ncbi:MAG: choice-of-anchor D domain-containing protein, partial [Bacteroidota bacterium]
MRNRIYLFLAVLGLVALMAAPGMAAPVSLSSTTAARAAAVSGPVISVSPLAHDFGIVNVGSMDVFMFTISNTGDADLNISTIMGTGSFTATGPSMNLVPAGGTATFVATYAPTMGLNETGTISIMSDASNGTFTVNVSGQGNEPPVLDPIGNKTADAFVNLSFTTTASDPNDQIDDVLSFSVSPALP